ncbi:alpha/beta hydrolase family protein [Amphibacillus indicireducens]|uniref:Alpha/beta fold hydrolase n=1 Tax=Amphibacillus indicireducens TaxID=1076330 RepID=A0ABP7VA42_9BACI
MIEWTKNNLRIEHNGREVFAVSYLPKIKDKFPIVIFSHGYNGSHKDFLLNSEYLARKGIGAVSFDFCGGSVNSKSDLKTTDMTIFTEYEDLSAVIDAVKGWDNVDANNIFLFGGSQGGLISALVADERIDEIKGLLLLFPALCIPDDWNKKFPTLDRLPDTIDFWGVTLGRSFVESIHGYQVFDHIGKYHKNVLIFHGDQDEVVPLDYGVRAAQHYPRAEIEVFDGEGHGFSESNNQKVHDLTYAFVKANS